MPVTLSNLKRTVSRRQLPVFLLCLAVWATVIVHPYPARSAEKAAELISHGGYLVEDGTGTRAHRANELFIPASTLKILTSLAALEILGGEYRFETHLFLDAENNLYIQGHGDPFLTSETVLDIGRKLYESGIRNIDTIFLDESVFALEGPTAGSENSTRSYDAPNGALVVNFNALPILVAKNGTISSGEPQTPTLPLMREIGPRLSSGFHRVNLSAFPGAPGLSPTLRYTGELFSAQLQQAGILVKSHLRMKMVPAGQKPYLIYKNNLSLSEIVRACLKKSNNFIANQLYLACGLKSSGRPATWQKSQLFFADYIGNTLNIPPTEIHMVEGSGLSRHNRITATALVQILNRFAPFASLLSPHDGIQLKSGTMRDIFCYAGYFEEDNRLIPFAILLNQEKNHRDRILKSLQNNRIETVSYPITDSSHQNR